MKNLKDIAPHEAQVVLIDALTEPAGNPPAPALERCSGDLAYILYTSGSTGVPKGVQIPHRAVVNLFSSMRREPGLTAEDTIVAAVTYSFDMSVPELLLPLILGARVVIAPDGVPADGPRLAALLQSSGATFLQAAPTTCWLLIEAGWEKSPNLKLLVGAEAWSAELAVELLPRCQSLWNMYGPTETTVWSAVSKVEPGAPVLIGRPVSNTTFYILDEHLSPVPRGVPGELYIGGDGLARGYLNREELTAERFIKNPFSQEPGSRLYKTGDLTRYLPDGRIEFLGRIDHQVKIRGFRIELGEIEAVLKKHRTIREAVVTVREDTPGQKRLAAYYVPRGHEAPSTAELRAFLSRKLPDYMTPTVFMALDAFPLTPNGKVNRAALPIPATGRSVPEEAAPLPVNSLELQFTEVWEELLGVKPIGKRDNFFELGGNSLLALRMVGRIEKLCGSRPRLAELFRDATIEHLVTTLLLQEDERLHAPVVKIYPEGTKTPFFFLHGDFSGGGFYCQNLARHIGADQPFFLLQPPGPETGAGMTVGEMAQHHLSVLRRVQPRGPYRLGGYCNGGVVAFEMARRLCKEGEGVDLLALVEAIVPTGPYRWLQVLLRGMGSVFGLASEAQIHLFLRLRDIGMHMDGMSILAKSAYVLGKIVESMAAGGPGRRHPLSEDSRVLADLELHRRIGLTSMLFEFAMEGYVPGRFKGEVALFMSRESAKETPAAAADWERHASKVTLRTVTGDHTTCITRHASELAEGLKNALAASRESS